MGAALEMAYDDTASKGGAGQDGAPEDEPGVKHRH